MVTTADDSDGVDSPAVPAVPCGANSAAPDTTSTTQLEGFMRRGMRGTPGTDSKYCRTDAPRKPMGPKYTVWPPAFSSSRSSKWKNSSADGWWIVHTMERPSDAIFRSVCTTCGRQGNRNTQGRRYTGYVSAGAVD